MSIRALAVTPSRAENHARGCEEAIRATTAAAWSGIATGRQLDDHPLHEAERDARRPGLADVVINIAGLRALAWEHKGALDDALECARRAARMGRTEKLPQSEYFVGVILARVRRLTGRPYLATRIAAALHRFASSPWWPWIEWEGCLAGGLSTTAIETTDGPAMLLRRVLVHAQAGDRAAFDAASQELADATQGFAPLRRDSDRLLAALDVRCDLEAADGLVRRWCRGDSPFEPPPFGLAGLIGAEAVHAGNVATVIVRPASPGRRVLRIARALTATDGAAPLDDDHVGRPEALSCALALAGPEGLDDGELFRRAYGFNYVPTLHRGTFDVALHRARARVAGRGQIERVAGRVRLCAYQPFTVPDPRTMLAADELVLRKLADVGEVAARELAGLLGMPLRTVQSSLRKLVDGGACQLRRDGRRIVYAIEDTTFQEPTLA